jgi:hypothetical protein
MSFRQHEGREVDLEAGVDGVGEPINLAITAVVGYVDRRARGKVHGRTRRGCQHRKGQRCDHPVHLVLLPAQR